jgi:hypothetical protein
MKVNRQAPKGGSFAFLDTTYFFCNPRCREKFAADPERYLYAQQAGDSTCRRALAVSDVSGGQ